MKVVTIAAPKGGSTKTTITTLLAVRAKQGRHNVCMIDLNADQGSLTQWWILRGKPANPHLEADIENITRDVAVLKASKRFDWLFIDTPPLDIDVIENAIAVADCVVIPVRAGIFDIGTIGSILEITQAHHKPFGFLLSAVDTRFKSLNATALAALTEDGPVFASTISYRLPYINALTAGKTGPEIDKDLQPEVNALWAEVNAMASHGQKPAAKTHKEAPS